jgi:hypothetical protein
MARLDRGQDSLDISSRTIRTREFQGGRKAHPAFAVNDIEALFAVFEGAGVSCVWHDATGGIRRFYAKDPWGNRLEFTEPSGAY